MITTSERAPLTQVRENRPTRDFLAAERGGARALDTGLDGYRRFRSWFTRPLLSRPALLDAEQTRRLGHDLPSLLSLLQSLPERLFDGDQEAFARALGWTGPSVAYALRHLSGPPVPLGRADLVHGPDGFRLVEFNTSSSLGSFEFGELCRASLTDPGFAAFADDQGLRYLDPLAMMADTLLERAGLSLADQPTVALVDWVTSPITVNASLFVDLMRDLGFRIVICTVADLELTPAGLFADGVRIDAVYRTFLFKTVAEDPQAPALLATLAKAVRTGAVTLFSPLNADLFGSKACLAMLSDPRHRDRFTDEELDVIDRLLPWTRSMADAWHTEAEPGVSLADHVLRHRAELVLKPSIGHAGQGVVGGWMVGQDAWADLVTTAAQGDWIVQQRVDSVAERFLPATGDGAPAGCFLHWGMFVTGGGLSGGFVKGLLDQEQDIRYLGDGSHVGCVFHAST